MLKYYVFLFCAYANTAVSQSNSNETSGQLNRYLGDAVEPEKSDALQFWCNRWVIYSKLSPIVEVLLSAPASQAIAERIFSLRGILPNAAAIVFTSHLKSVHF